MPEEKLISAMAAHHEELAKADVLLYASGLKPSSKGWRIKYSGGKRTVIDGPFAETKEVMISDITSTMRYMPLNRCGGSSRQGWEANMPR